MTTSRFALDRLSSLATFFRAAALTTSALIALSGCSDIEQPALSDAEVAARRTILAGVFGTVEHRATIIDGETAEGISDHGAGRKVRVHELVATVDQATNVSSTDEYGRYDVKTPLVVEAKVDADGFYQIGLDPGTYSVFIEDGDAWYCNEADDEGLCVVTITSAPLRHDILIDYDTAY